MPAFSPGLIVRESLIVRSRLNPLLLSAYLSLLRGQQRAILCDRTVPKNSAADFRLTVGGAASASSAGRMEASRTSVAREISMEIFSPPLLILVPSKQSISTQGIKKTPRDSRADRRARDSFVPFAKYSATFAVK
jgi:hypothetical protein